MFGGSTALRIRRDVGGGDSRTPRAGAGGEDGCPVSGRQPRATTTKAPTRRLHDEGLPVSRVRPGHASTRATTIWSAIRALPNVVRVPPRLAGVPGDRLPADLSDGLQGEGRGHAARRRAAALSGDGAKTVFRPGLATRTQRRDPDRGRRRSGESLERQLGRVSADGRAAIVGRTGQPAVGPRGSSTAPPCPDRHRLRARASRAGARR